MHVALCPNDISYKRSSPAVPAGPLPLTRRQTPAGHSRRASYILMSDRYPDIERPYSKADTIKMTRSYPSGCLPPCRGKGPTGYDRVLSDLFICEGIRACQRLNCLLYQWPALSPTSCQRGSQSGRSPCHRALTRPSLCLL